MEGLVLVLLIGAVVSILSKIKKNPEDNSTGGKTVFDDWAKMFSSQGDEQEVKKDPIINNYETNNYEEKKTVSRDNTIRTNSITEEKDMSDFNLRKAVIYSSILDRPYK